MPRQAGAGFWADALAAAMTERGFTTVVFRTRQHKAHPAVWIAGWEAPPARCVYVGPHAGELWYFAASLSPVAPCLLTGFAASVIAAWPAPVWVPLLRTAAA